MESFKSVILEFNQTKNNKNICEYIQSNFDESFNLISNFNVIAYGKTSEIIYTKKDVCNYLEKIFKNVYINKFDISNNKYNIKLYYDHECIVYLEFVVEIVNNILFNITINKI